MGILSSAFRSVNPISLVQVGLGPAGWTSMAMRMAVSQAVQAGIQQFGQGMGLPQFAIDMMQSRAAGSLGDFRGQFSNYREAMGGLNRAINASPFQAARNERMAEQTYDKVFELMGKMLKQARDEATGSSSSKGGTGKNWIRALVEAMGSRLDSLAGEMSRLGKEVDNGAKKSGELQAVAAEFGLIQQALATVMKTVAEGQQNLARKSG